MIIFWEIDKSNYMGYIYLKVKGEQRGSVADNTRSLTEVRPEEGLYICVVYSDGVMVGLVLFDYDLELPRWYMSRLIIGAQYQGRSLGKEAVLRFLDFMREHMGARELYLHAELGNTMTYEMYQKLGFHVVREIQYTFDGVVYREWRMRIYL